MGVTLYWVLEAVLFTLKWYIGKRSDRGRGSLASGRRMVCTISYSVRGGVKRVSSLPPSLAVSLDNYHAAFMGGVEATTRHTVFMGGVGTLRVPYG